MQTFRLLLLLGLALGPALRAELKLPAIIGDHMVLQQKLANPIWGWDTPGTKVTVTFAGQSHAATAGADGRWTVKLSAVAANATPQTLAISGTSKREIKDVLVGEVWMCSGQSNMQWSLAQTYTGDIEGARAKRPNIRIVSVPQVGTQELKTDFKGQWEVATPENVKAFSAIGYLYGRTLHDVLEVPIGLIDNAWGGSAAQAWIRRETIAAEDILHDLGAFSMISSDSQAMGRIGEVILRTWQTAHKMKVQRGALSPDSAQHDNLSLIHI